ncbi:MAG TPA: WecB/TagA/CpsF family glycosyltransferase [Pirellulales bacterium]|nr:WecB/TagA/CpsF family glycosyltransferase [Pirellulales bacterium]
MSLEIQNQPLAAGTTPAAPVWPQKVDLFGVGVSVTTYDEAVELVLDAAARRQSAVVACQAVHAVVTASRDAALREMVNAFELVTPDGQPVRWAMNLLHGAGLLQRVYGPELMHRICRGAAERGTAIYLYGGTPAVLDKLQANQVAAFPKLRIAGAESPPFRALTEAEDRAVVDRIEASGAGVVFIGLGCPKQDRFAHAHRGTIRAVQLCVGAAFDFHAGVKPMAPEWMQRHGLEWLFRLAQEPRRLWRRYLVTNSLFLAMLAAAWLRSWRIARSSGAPRSMGTVSGSNVSAS